MKKLNSKGAVDHIFVGVLILVLAVGGFLYFRVMNSADDDSYDSPSIAKKAEYENVTAADLRVGLNNALREHVNLGGVALRNVFTESADAEAAVAALDKNSMEVASLVGVAYGEEAEENFLELWRQHITFFANYTVGARDGDSDATAKAMEDLMGYGEAASNFFESANPNLPKSAVKPLLGEHRALIVATIDLIGAGDFDAAYVKLAEAADQVGTIADALATGIATQMPEKFPGDIDDPGVDLRVVLNRALREHVNVAGVALRNVYTKSPDADAAVAALDNNSVEVAGLVGGVYGADAETSFLELWRQHITFFANYTVAARDGDAEGMEKAKTDLMGYGEAASNFFESANPNLPKSAVMPLLEEHRSLVLETIGLIGEGDFEAAYMKLGEAADQAGTIADALAGGIEKQYPEKF